MILKAGPAALLLTALLRSRAIRGISARWGNRGRGCRRGNPI